MRICCWRASASGYCIYMKLSLRQATPADARAIKMIDTVVPRDPSRAVYIDAWLEQDLVLVAELAGKLIGYGVLKHAFFRQPQLEMLMIATDYRGQQIGEQLLLALEQHCDSPKFWVTPNLSNYPMQKLLKRLGYTSCGYINELDPGDPELVYVKRRKLH